MMMLQVSEKDRGEKGRAHVASSNDLNRRSRPECRQTDRQPDGTTFLTISSLLSGEQARDGKLDFYPSGWPDLFFFLSQVG